MRLPFRQGIVRAEPNFLQKTGTGVTLKSNNIPFTATLSHGGSEYLHIENATVTNAWAGTFPSGSDYYLYIDINTLSAAVSYGYSTLEPIFSSNEPVSPVDGQVWFDISNTSMFEWSATGGSWVPVIRVFVAKITGGVTVNYIYPVNNSQAGISLFLGNLDNYFPSGSILFDAAGNPIFKPNREFFTTEDDLYFGKSQIQNIRLESNVHYAIASTTLAAYQVVRMEANNRMALANYSDTGSSVLAIVLQNALINATASIMLQGVVTNPAWSINGWNVNDKLWVHTNGQLVNADPNTTNPITYPNKQVPVARVLTKDTIIFEQGLGGIIELPPLGGSADPATDTTYGTVLLKSPTSSSIVVSDNDPRLSGAPFAPLVHTHVASDVSVTPTGDITATNVQAAIAQVDTLKLSKSGGTMTGPLYVSTDPAAALQVATKNYVDSLVSGLLWISAIQHVNLISDTLTTPPVTPAWSDVYIPASGASGAWSGLSGHLVVWNGSSWTDLGLLSSFPAGSRFGIAMETATIPGGTFAGKADDIAILDNPAGPSWSFYSPILNNAVYVNNATSLHAYHQYAYNGTQWVEFGGGESHVPGSNLTLTGNILDVKQWSSGGTVDAATIQGNTPTDFVSVTGDTITGSLQIDTGLVVGAPTGGNQGAGTINAEAMYIDGVSINASNTKGYKHTQAVASSTWNITHNLGTEFINVTVWLFVGSVWTQALPLSVEITGVNGVDITFSSPYTGRAVIIAVL